MTDKTKAQLRDVSISIRKSPMRGFSWEWRVTVDDDSVHGYEYGYVNAISAVEQALRDMGVEV